MVYHEYISVLKKLNTGKKIKGTIYVHEYALQSTSKKLIEFIKELKRKSDIGPEYNVIKFNTTSFSVSFLSYPNFFKLPHPILHSSIIINVEAGQVKKINFTKSVNPPILHRKENLLKNDHSQILIYKALTKSEEAAGLYDNPLIIGNKRTWDQLLEEKGLGYKGHELVKVDSTIGNKIEAQEIIEVKRHKTAISRYNFSKPIRTIQENGLLKNSSRLFDYGCGKADDVKALQKLGYNAVGWDPIFRPDVEKISSDIVNLGFVINVIEDISERSKTLKDAFGYAEKLLIISTMVANSTTEKLGKPYKDGILTKNNTFQKYFRQNELRDYIESTLGTGAIAAGPGIFYIFKDPVEQQEFLSTRSRKSIDWVDLSRGLYPDRPVRMRKKDMLYEENKDLVDRFWEKMLELGRLPKPEEFEWTQELRSKFGTSNAARKLFAEKFGEGTLKEAFKLRKNDILVYLALSNFKKKVPFYHLSRRLQNDIKTFLGSYKAGLEKSKELLFSIGNPDTITELCHKTEFGYFDHKAQYIHKSLLNDLHPILRIYVGCAGILYGDLKNVDIIKIHKKSGKVTLLIYDDFKNKYLPELKERVKVNLRKQRIDFFDHKSETHQQVLYFKERYVTDKHPLRRKWVNFSKKLKKIGIDDNVTFGPSKNEFHELIERKGLTRALNTKRLPRKNNIK
jgi:DNA phosphorothioation-associated putative methyltransferase